MPKAQLAMTVGHSSTQLDVWGVVSPPAGTGQSPGSGSRGEKPWRLSECGDLWYQKMAKTPLSFCIFPVCAKVQTKMKTLLLIDWNNACR